MRKFISVVVLSMFVGIAAFAQSVMTPSLQDALNEKSNQRVDVLVYLDRQFDALEFHSRMSAQRASKDTRVKQIQSELKQIADLSQNRFKNQLAALAQRGVADIEWVESYWVMNVVRLSLSPNSAYEIADLPMVINMDINSPRYTVEGPVSMQDAQAKAEGGIEPGLSAIKAPFMWNKGYTGKNLLFLSVDTGVHPSHPAISNRFLGNHRPLNQAWYGVRSSMPFDHANSSHGTHTTGTVLGLVENTNDTIGVAYSAYWIATDPVASQGVDILPPAQLLAVYQWVLNPDGNDQTTDDVPDVINNSWGYNYEMAADFDACNLNEAQVLEVIEAAGILSPFSAGNEGPNPQTTGFPAMMAYSELNVMSVGALDANNDAWNIAGFSSHGPTPCIELGDDEELTPLVIKPEVSAPGVNVRSCSGTNEFSSLSGTSMACPHVAGAMLLLKEAFPLATVTEIKESLYQTAIDLGDTGEDNVYGRGMIDLEAAFNHLDNTYDAVPPVTDSFDVAVEIRDFSSGLVCPDNQTIAPKLALINKGQETLNTIEYSYSLNSGDTVTATFTGSLAAGQEELIELGNISLAEGNNEMYAWVSSSDITREFDIYNNAQTLTSYVIKNTNFPYLEDVESYQGSVISDNWYVDNPDAQNGWDIVETNEGENHAFRMEFRRYYPREWQQDFLYSSMITLPETNERINLSFDLAYKRRLDFLYNDSLSVAISTDCGQTFPVVLFKDGGQTLATLEGNSGSGNYIPETSEDWDTVNLDLSAYAGQRIIVRFMAENDMGNNLYIDNVRLYTGAPNYIAEKPQVQVELFPNPAHQSVYVKHQFAGQVNYQIFDVKGQMVKFNKLNDNTSIDLSKLNNGVYTVRLFDNENVVVKQLIVQ